MNIPQEEVLLAIKSLKQNLAPILNVDFLTQLQTAGQLAKAEIHQKNPGFQMTDEFNWRCVENFNSIIHLFDKPIQDNWETLYNFLMEHVGMDVLANRLQKQQAKEVFQKFKENNELITDWDIPVTSLQNLIDEEITSLHYVEESGWGKTSHIAVSHPLSYGELWKIADVLVRVSGDIHTNVIKGIRQLPLQPGKYALCLSN